MIDSRSYCQLEEKKKKKSHGAWWDKWSRNWTVKSNWWKLTKVLIALNKKEWKIVQNTFLFCIIYVIYFFFSLSMHFSPIFFFLSWLRSWLLFLFKSLMKYKDRVRVTPISFTFSGSWEDRRKYLCRRRQRSQNTSMQLLAQFSADNSLKQGCLDTHL